MRGQRGDRVARGRKGAAGSTRAAGTDSRAFCGQRLGEVGRGTVDGQLAGTYVCRQQGRGVGGHGGQGGGGPESPHCTCRRPRPSPGPPPAAPREPARTLVSRTASCGRLLSACRSAMTGSYCHSHSRDL